MIAAISIMRRRSDLTSDQFRRHWLDPHGVMTAELPGTRRYVQSHCLADAPGTNDYARSLEIEGFPELWFESYEARHIAYTSKRIAECNVDSEQFVGSVTRLVTEPIVAREPARQAKPAKIFVLATGMPDVGWADRLQARTLGLPGVIGYIRQRIIEQAKAPASKIPELVLPVAGLAEVIFSDEEALLASLPVISGMGEEAARTAIWRVEDYEFV